MFDPKSLCVYDPIIRLIWHVSHGKKWRVLLLAVGINGVFCLGLGALVAFFSASGQVLSPFQPQTFPLEVFIYIVTLPTVWIYYVWEPQSIVDIFNGLSQNDVIKQNEDQTYSTVEEFLKAKRANFNKVYYSFIALSFTIVNFLIWASAVFTPHNPFWFEHPQVWWEVNPLYFWLVWVPLVWGCVYMVWYTFIRRAITFLLIAQFLKRFTLTPKLFHYDRANGLSPIGNYPLSFTLLTLVAGIWIFLVIVWPVFSGNSINLKYDTLIYILLYFILAYVGLIAPTWKTHIVMRTIKFQALEVVATEIQRLVSQTTSDRPTEHVIVPKEVIKNIKALEWEYRLLEREYHTWPFNLTSLNFLASTLLPLVFSGIPIVLQLFGK